MIIMTITKKTLIDTSNNEQLKKQMLLYYEFAGCMLGLSMIHEVPLGINFSHAIIKYLLSKKPQIEFSDLQSYDETMYQMFVQSYFHNTEWLTENKDETFIIYDEFEKKKEIPLIKNGDKILINEKNKNEFLTLYAQHRLTYKAENKLQSIAKGFWSILPLNIISKYLTVEYIHDAILGSNESIWNIDEWEASCIYVGFNRYDVVIKWFWSYVRSLSREDLSNLLLFWTGSRIPPLHGFKKEFRISDNGVLRIHLLNSFHGNVLPKASTCSYILHIPSYQSLPQLTEKFNIALKYGIVGYGEE